MRESRHALPIVLLVSTALTGCVEVDGPPVNQNVQTSSPCPAGTPKRKAVPLDLIDAFPSCEQNMGRLIPDFLIPADFHSKLAAGPKGTLCVPVEFATNAEFTPKACTSVFGVKGACLSPALPDVKNAPIKLPKADCPGDQLCAPCIDPTTKKATGACDFGLMACDPPENIDDCKPFPPEPSLLQQYQPCCNDGPAHCAPPEYVDPGQAKDLNMCADGTSYCVPDEILSRGGKYQPPSCRTMNREGRCLSLCIKSVSEQASQLEQGTCASHERCVPCYDPRTGLGTGACTVGPCDKPKEPAKAFETCGGTSDGSDALCVPNYLVPASDRCHFDNIGCKSGGCAEPGTLCVPKKIIDAGPTYEPKKCKASMSGFLALFMTIFSDPFAAFSKMDDYSEGACISKCMKDVRTNSSASMLSSNGCDADELCVPCYDPTKLSQGKVPTGACDRPTCPGSQ